MHDFTEESELDILIELDQLQAKHSWDALPTPASSYTLVSARSPRPAPVSESARNFDSRRVLLPRACRSSA